jgi:hypothetical protein
MGRVGAMLRRWVEAGVARIDAKLIVCVPAQMTHRVMRTE